MSFYSDKNRMKLAWLLKIIIILNIIIYLVDSSILYLVADPYAFSDIIQVGTSVAIGFVIYEKLQDNKDNFWMKLAEVLASIQVFVGIVVFFILAVAFSMGVLGYY